MGLSGVLRQPAGVMADCRFLASLLGRDRIIQLFHNCCWEEGSFRRLSAIGVVGQPCILADFSPESGDKVISKNIHHIRIALILVLKSNINYGLCEMD